MDLKKFQNKIIVRSMREEDFDVVIELERLCFPQYEAYWTREQLKSQIGNFPEGQIVIEFNNRIVASSSSIIVDFDEYDDDHTWTEIADYGFIKNHDPKGDTIYGLEMMVHPEFRGMKLARRLYDARKQLCIDLNLRRMIVGGRIPGYVRYKKKISVREYVERVQKGKVFDPVLSVQLANGFILKRLIPSYDESDKESDTWAALLEWINLDFRPHGRKKAQLANPARICVVQYQMRNITSFEGFHAQCEYFIDVASNYQCDFILFPEIFTTQLISIKPQSTARESLDFLNSFTESYLQFFTSASLKYNINIVAGSHFTLEDETVYNISYLFKRNGEIGKQYKLHITSNERRWWGVQGGKNIEVFETDKGKVAILVCYDIEFPELARIAVNKGARIVFVPFCTDERHGYLRIRCCAQSRCIENQVYVAISGTVGNLPAVENMDIHYAQSGIFTPSDFGFARDGVAAECTPNIETVVIQDVDLAVLERHRQRGTVTNWKDRRLDIYEIIEKS